MADMGLIMQLIIVGVVFAIDTSLKVGELGFLIAMFYLCAAAYALFTKDVRTFKRRMFVVVLFAVEIVAVAGFRDNPPDLSILDRWVHKQAE